jgi:hypothetical protein
MKSVAKALCALLSLLCLWGGAGAQAEPLTYSVSATFGDGGTASGVFTFDADIPAYSNISITVTNSATPALDGTYTIFCPPASGMTGCEDGSFAGQLYVLKSPPADPIYDAQVVNLVYSAPLTDAGTSVTANGGYGTCSTAPCQGIEEGTDAVRRIQSATVSLPTIPTLTERSVAAFALLLSGFAVRRLRRAGRPKALG